ncbi:hypothetical protein BFAG_02062 [Bacteroides fragilis 3_1_12]|uniref:Lipoprotein n=1 Tax=Bacteroides fragilis 3_1_12 TaxID=457424 RepID=A0ABN0BKF4_BACFG|nr:hypothetical protein BFAG_02062 [Bacteroides fragilis 3_1_12]
MVHLFFRLKTNRAQLINLCVLCVLCGERTEQNPCKHSVPLHSKKVFLDKLRICYFAT